MASSSDSWMREFNEASKLADDINSMISERSSLAPSGPETQRHFSAIRRKITILGTRLDSLQSLLSKLSSKQPMPSFLRMETVGGDVTVLCAFKLWAKSIQQTTVLTMQFERHGVPLSWTSFRTEKEMNRRKDMLANLRSKANQMASALNMSNFANRDSLFGQDIKPADAMSRTTGLDNYEQDEGLEKLEGTVLSTKHIALAVNEELDLHSRLLDNLDQHVDSTDSRLQQRVQKNLAILNKRTKGGCSCMCLLLSVIGIVILVAVIWVLIKYL
ncbi:hypothetical protein HHK36_007858 [Tetracentron sinense]|uniref:t-SNARE coiled-coil homology domain-containing protein n=1 Tax=Tetracentron sinense TaxID=13715 RepID=A0A834ZHF1_TETSI|nr:hypothetical protein HHK36_007858 [Tetracentron sinense]